MDDGKIDETSPLPSEQDIDFAFHRLNPFRNPKHDFHEGVKWVLMWMNINRKKKNEN